MKPISESHLYKYEIIHLQAVFFFFFSFLDLLFEKEKDIERDRESMSGRERDREGKSQTDSLLSMEPKVELDPRTYEMMT